MPVRSRPGFHFRPFLAHLKVKSRGGEMRVCAVEWVRRRRGLSSEQDCLVSCSLARMQPGTTYRGSPVLWHA
jgi:hypothetical protein